MLRRYYISEHVQKTEGTLMASIFETVLGECFGELDGSLQAYFGSLAPDEEGVARGVFREAGLRRRLLTPLFRMLGSHGIAFAEFGVGVEFVARNTEADGIRRATRLFRYPRAERVMVDRMHARDGRIVDRVGDRGQVEVEFEVRVVDGGLRMRSRRLALHVAGVRVPLPRVASFVLRERARATEQHVDLRVSVPVWGEIYGYDGVFVYTTRRRVVEGFAPGGTGWPG
jgi:hypothetical protein